MSTLPTLAQLRHLIALHEALHFSRAAERCFVTQSTLSASIKELESALGAQLVERDKRNVAFTDLGEEVVQRARAIVAQAEDLVAACNDSHAPFVGKFRLNAIPTIAPFVFPKLLPVLRRSYPQLQCYLREEQTLALLESVRSGQADAGILALPFALPDALEAIEIAADPFVFVSSKVSNENARALPIDRLQREPLLLLEDGHCLRAHAITSCRIGSDAQERAISATSLATLVQMVESGLGATLLPQLAVSGGILAGHSLFARAITPKPPARIIAIVVRKTSSRKAEITLLAEAVRSLIAEAIL
jgi:LysR family transcriptional regulator, hydrogen peroxide-inducible genes activator